MAADRPPDARPRPWPQPSQKTLALFNARHELVRLVSASHTSAQKLMLFLADVPPEKRPEAFDEECFNHVLAPSTATTYWTAWLSVQGALGLPQGPHDAACTKRLKARATTFRVKFPRPLLREQMKSIVARSLDSEYASTALILVAWTLGQRISDMLQVATANVSVASDGHVHVLFSQGKTIGKVIQPYHLFLEAGSEPATLLLKVQENARRNRWLFLVTPSNADADVEPVKDQIRMILALEAQTLQLRSIRRGGLQAMASKPGVSLEEVLKFSKHQCVATLYTYLDYGAAATNERSRLLAITRAMSTTEEPPQEAPAEPAPAVPPAEATSPKRSKGSKKKTLAHGSA